MKGQADPAPRWVEAVLRWPPALVLARLALASAYLIGGVDKLLHFADATAEQAHFGLHPDWLWAAMAAFVEIVGALLLILGRLVWLAAGALSALTLVAMLVANNFWSMQGHERFMAMNAFFEHAGLIGGMALAAMLASGRRGAEDSRRFSSVASRR